MKIAENILQLIGETPLVRLNRLVDSSLSTVLAKLEYFNPASSTKDRAALSMIRHAEEAGTLKPGGTIVEPTSGNTGIGLAMIASIEGYRLILTMPESMSEERKRLLAGLGAELQLTPAMDGMKGAIARAHELTGQLANAIMLDQFANPANPEAHYRTTAEEIWRDTGGKIDVLVSAVGTGGTLTGTARKLREYNPSLLTVAVEPEESPVISGGKPGAHGIQGIGAGFVPTILDRALIDRIVRISTREALSAARELIRREGILCGISSGAAACAAVRIAGEPENTGKTIVFIAPDAADRYLSTQLFADGEESA